MSVADKNMLLVFERKILRMIFNAVYDPDGWRSHYNDELYQMYRDRNTLFLRSANNNYGLPIV